MARLLISVPDPVSSPVLLIGSYVRVRMAGVMLDSVAALDRNLLRDGDYVWLMDDQDQLQMRAVKVILRSRDEVFVSSGLKAGERVVMTNLSAPVSGMPLRTQRPKGIVK